MREPLIAVVSPCYNVAPYLKDYCDSLLGQTYQNFEVFVCDDGSDDGSSEILDEWASKFVFARDCVAQKDGNRTERHNSADTGEYAGRIHIIRKTHSGISQGYSAALSAALSAARTDFIAFVDSDDWVEPDYLSSLVCLQKETNADISVCGYFRNDDAVRNKIPLKQTICKDRNEILSLIFDSDNYRGIKAVLWNKLFRASLFHDNLRMDTRFSSGGDQLLVANCVLRAESAAFTDKPLYHYRIRENSIMRNEDFRKRSGLEIAFEEIIALLGANGIGGDAVMLVKRFHTYFSSQLAEFAHENGDADALEYSKKKIKKFLPEYLAMCEDHRDRTERINRILSL